MIILVNIVFFVYITIFSFFYYKHEKLQNKFLIVLLAGGAIYGLIMPMFGVIVYSSLQTFVCVLVLTYAAHFLGFGLVKVVDFFQRKKIKQ